MTATLVRGVDLGRKIRGGLTPQVFSKRILCEGDSWMDFSGPAQGSLPDALLELYSQSGENVLIVNIAHIGDTMKQIGDIVDGDFKRWMNKANQWKFDAILLSAGGNDYIDAADVDFTKRGKGILSDFNGQLAPINAAECVNSVNMDLLGKEWVEDGYNKLYDLVQGSPQAGTPIFLNLYDTPTPRFAPALKGRKAWLAPAFKDHAIPPELWQGVTDLIFAHLGNTIKNWADGHQNVQCIPTTGKLVPAVPGTGGSSNDWLNEIHPNPGGWKKLAKVWADSIGF